MNDMEQALLDFKSSGYKIDVVITSKNYLPLTVKVEEDGKISLSDENRCYMYYGSYKDRKGRSDYDSLGRPTDRFNGTIPNTDARGIIVKYA